MRVTGTVLLLLLLWAKALLAAPPDTSPVFEIPRLAGITIDGKADDWGEQGFRVDQFLSVSATNTPGALVSTANHDVRLRLGWDNAGLLLLLTIHDDRWVEEAQEDRLYQEDSVTLYLAPARGATDTCQWVITPGMTTEHPTLRWHLYNYRHTEALKTLPADLTAARAPIPGGVMLEVRIPWSSLAITPDIGREMAFECWSNDIDNPRASAGHRLSWYPLLGAFSDSARMYRLRLTEQPGPPVSARAYGVTGGNQPPRVTVIAPVEQIGKKVQVMSGKTPAAQGPLVPDAFGLASVTLALPRARSSAADGAYSVLLDGVPLESVSFPKAGQADAIERLKARAELLRANFNLDQPWDDMSNAPPIIRRHRGVVALALEWLDPRAWTDDEEDRDDAVAAMAAMIEALDQGHDALGEQHGSFWAAYYSRVDGSGQPFVVILPADFSPLKTYPLIVKLHGMGGRPTPETAPLNAPYIVVRPWGRGENFYQALGEDDVLQVIAYMREWYHIDPDRIYLTGGSMGGTGTWNVASRYPDLFAALAPYCGTTIGPFLENLRNVPTLNQHGAKDWTVPVDMSRYGMNLLEELGYPVTYREYPDADHDVQGQPSGPWLMQHARVAAPMAVTLTFDRLADGNAYWMHVRAVEDAHRRGTVQASIDGGPYQTLTIDATNAGVLELDVAHMPVDAALGLHLLCGSTPLQVKAPLPATVYLIRRDNIWTVAEQWAPPAAPMRPYEPGGAAGLFTGEPLLVVYGTQGTPARAALWKGAAEKLATFAGAHQTAVGYLLSKPDRAVTPDDLTHYNLILLGGAADNAVTAQVMPRLPVTFTPDGLLVAGERAPVSVRHAGWGLAYYNPLAPRRLLYLVASDAPDKELEVWLRWPAALLVGARGWDRIAEPDLYVQEIHGPLRRLMQFTTGWAWRAPAGADRPLPERTATNWGVALAQLRALRAAADADVALGAGADVQRAYDTHWITAADIATLTAPLPTLTCRMTGRELLDLQRTLAARGDIIVLPAVEVPVFVPDHTYRVAMPPNLCKLLAQKRHMNLTDTEAGPAAPAEAVWGEMFGN